MVTYSVHYNGPLHWLVLMSPHGLSVSNYPLFYWQTHNLLLTPHLLQQCHTVFECFFVYSKQRRDCYIAANRESFKIYPVAVYMPIFNVCMPLFPQIFINIQNYITIILFILICLNWSFSPLPVRSFIHILHPIWAFTLQMTNYSPFPFLENFWHFSY